MTTEFIQYIVKLKHFQLSVGSNQAITLILVLVYCGLRLAVKCNWQVIELVLLLRHSIKAALLLIRPISTVQYSTLGRSLKV